MFCPDTRRRAIENNSIKGLNKFKFMADFFLVIMKRIVAQSFKFSFWTLVEDVTSWQFRPNKSNIQHDWCQKHVIENNPGQGSNHTCHVCNMINFNIVLMSASNLEWTAFQLYPWALYFTFHASHMLNQSFSTSHDSINLTILRYVN
jgi:hypothetical protein